MKKLSRVPVIRAAVMEKLNMNLHSSFTEASYPPIMVYLRNEVQIPFPILRYTAMVNPF